MYQQCILNSSPTYKQRQQTPIKILPSASRAEPPPNFYLKHVKILISEAKSPNKTCFESTDGVPSASRRRTEPFNQFTSSFDFRSLPNAAPRKRRRTERKKGKSMIVTDTPNENETLEKTNIKKEKKERLQKSEFLKVTVKKKQQ